MCYIINNSALPDCVEILYAGAALLVPEAAEWLNPLLIKSKTVDSTRISISLNCYNSAADYPTVLKLSVWVHHRSADIAEKLNL